MPRPPVSQPPPTRLLRLRHILDQDRGLVTVRRSPAWSHRAAAVSRLCVVVADASEASDDDGSLHRRQ